MQSNTMWHSDEVEVVIASPGSRIAAYLLNLLFSIVAYLPLLFFVLWPLMTNDWNATENVDINWLSPGVLGGFAILLIYGVWQLWMMGKHGQSLGKRVMNIRVLKKDGSNPGFIGTVLMREVVYNLLLAVVALVFAFLIVLVLGADMGEAESVGNLISFAASVACFVMLFNKDKDRRTLQDYVAGTVVVQLPKK
ncbi:RDD family protein [Neisseria arctica]|nr:RDD family protein [Neisseria arctica]UOO86461.1 RDD family protein [Neisseria arctica]